MVMATAMVMVIVIAIDIDTDTGIDTGPPDDEPAITWRAAPVFSWLARRRPPTGHWIWARDLGAVHVPVAARNSKARARWPGGALGRPRSAPGDADTKTRRAVGWRRVRVAAARRRKPPTRRRASRALAVRLRTSAA